MTDSKPVIATEAPPRVRTFLIADIRGYTTFTRTHGDATAARLAAKFAELARDAVEARNGSVIELRGDEALAVFVDAAQAVRAAVELQALCSEETAADRSLPFPVGVGLDAGEAVAVEGGFRGAALNTAARLCSRATAGQVLGTRTLADLVGSIDGISFRDAGPAELKGFDQPIDLVEFEAAPPVALSDVSGSPTGPSADQLGMLGVEPLPPELDAITPLVGREHQMHWLRGTWRQARRGHGRVVFVTGPAGIGKMRLAAELAAEVHPLGVDVRSGGSGGAAAAEAVNAVGTAARSTVPMFVVLGDLDVLGDVVVGELAASVEAIEGRPVLVVGMFRDAESSPALAKLVERVDVRGDGQRRLPPLDLDGVREIVRLYAGEEAADAPIESMLRSSGGIPGRIHEVVSGWARDEAKRRVAAAVEWLAAGRGRLQEELDFANNVIGLRLARLYNAERAEAAPEAGSHADCPYRGLASFAETDSDHFFGRERLVGELAARIASAGLLGVIGPSGSGKSSVVAAGLLPSLSSGLLPGSDRWVRVAMRPGDHPVTALASALAPVAGGDADADPDLAAVAEAIGSRGRLILFVDQFEELFTTCEDEDERTHFVAALTQASNDGDRFGVVLAVRADFYGHCAAYPELADLLGANQVLVGPMTRDELRRAIEFPARRAGLRVESALVEALVAEVGDEPGGLPLLSTTLVELWDDRADGWLRMESHERTGGVRGAVARLAESAFDQLQPPQREVARRVFLRLTGTGEGEAVVRRRAPISEFELDRDVEAAAVLAVLTEWRLLTVDDGMVEVAHEALLREWPRLQHWLDEDVQGRQLRRHLTVASRQWHDAGRDQAELYRGARLSVAIDWAATHGRELNELEREFLSSSRKASEAEAEGHRRTNRRLRGLLAGVAVFLVVALIAGGLALVQRGHAQEQRTKAEAAATAAEAQRLGAQALVAKSPDLSLLLARQAVALNDSAQTRSTLLAALLRWQGVLRILRPNGNRLLRIAVSPGDDWLAVSDNDSTLFVYDTRSYRLQWKKSTGFVDEMAASRDGQTLFVAHQPDDSGKETIQALDPATGEARWSVKASLGDGTLAATPDGLVLWQNEAQSGLPNEPRRRATLAAFRATDGAVVRIGARVPVDSERFTLVGSHEIAVGKDSSTVILDLNTGQTVRTLAVSPSFTAASADGLKLAVGDESGNVRLFDLGTGEHTQLNAPFTYVPGPLVFAPDGGTIAAGGGNGVVLTWDVATRRATSLHGQTGNVNGVAFSADSRTLYTDALDGTAVVWDLATDRSLRRTFDAHDGGAPGAEPFLPYFAFSPKDDELAVVDHADHRIRFLHAKTFEVVGALPKDSSACCVPPAIDFAGNRMATVDTMGVDLWDPARRTLIRRLYTSPNQPKEDQVPVDAVAISPDGHVVAANDGSTVLLLDAASGRIVRRLDAGAYVFGVNFGAHGDLLASFNQDRSVTMWNAFTGRQLWRKKISDGDLYFPDFSPDGRLYAIGTDVGLVHVFEARSGRAFGKPFVGGACFVLNVGFNPVTGVLASTGCDGTTTLADPATGQVIGSPLPGSPEGWALLAWDRSGERLAVLDNFGAGYLWDMSEDHWKSFACDVAGRTLNRDEWRQFLPDRPYEPACAAG